MGGLRKICLNESLVRTPFRYRSITFLQEIQEILRICLYLHIKTSKYTLFGILPEKIIKVQFLLLPKGKQNNFFADFYHMVKKPMKSVKLLFKYYYHSKTMCYLLQLIMDWNLPIIKQLQKN